MADGGVEQVEAALQASGLEGAVGRGIELRVLAAVADVDLVDVVHEFHGLLLADVFVQRAAEVVRQIIFAVGERACAAEAVHDRAGRALFKHGDLLVRTELRELVGGENAAGAGADNDHIILHGKIVLSIGVLQLSITYPAPARQAGAG